MTTRIFYENRLRVGSSSLLQILAQGPEGVGRQGQEGIWWQLGWGVCEGRRKGLGLACLVAALRPQSPEGVWTDPHGAALLPTSSCVLTAVTWHPRCTEVHLSVFHSNCKVAVGTRSKVGLASATCFLPPAGVRGRQRSLPGGLLGRKWEQDAPLKDLPRLTPPSLPACSESLTI